MRRPRHPPKAPALPLPVLRERAGVRVISRGTAAPAVIPGATAEGGCATRSLESPSSLASRGASRDTSAFRELSSSFPAKLSPDSQQHRRQYQWRNNDRKLSDKCKRITVAVHAVRCIRPLRCQPIPPGARPTLDHPAGEIPDQQRRRKNCQPSHPPLPDQRHGGDEQKTKAFGPCQRQQGGKHRGKTPPFSSKREKGSAEKQCKRKLRHRAQRVHKQHRLGKREDQRQGGQSIISISARADSSPGRIRCRLCAGRANAESTGRNRRQCSTAQCTPGGPTY